MPVYEMKYSPLGRTGLNVSRISYGGAGLGNIYSETDRDDGIRCVHKAVDEYGINYFDTAPSYGAGSLAEARLGEALSGGYRDRVILASKCGDYYAGDTRESWFRDYSAGTIREQLERQLLRLQTDHLDILQLHDIDCQPLDRLLEESIPEMKKLREEGKTRFIGITSISLPSLRYILEHTDGIDVVLTFGRYNLMDTSLTGYFDDLRSQQGFALLNCSVLFMGLISRALLDRSYRSSRAFTRREGFPETEEALREAEKLCLEHGTELGDLAVQFGCDCPMCDSTMISMSRTVRLDHNMQLLSGGYDRALAEQVRGILTRHSLIPDSFGAITYKEKI